MPSKEYQPLLEIDGKTLQGYFDTFINRDDTYALQQINRAYYRVERHLTLPLITAHLKGLITLGTYALNQASQGRWLCLDADENKSWTALKDLARQLETEGIIPYLESSRRGGHLWLFTAPLPGKQLRQFGIKLLQKYKVSSVELYPKQDELKPGGTGSLVRLPLGIHRKTGQRYPFITPEGQLLAPDLQQQIELLANPLQVPAAFITLITTRMLDTTALLPQDRGIARAKNVSGEYLSERIKRSISVYDFVRSYVELDHQGKGHCPFHDDHIQSFQVNVRENYWSCYAGCGGGSLIDFWMKWRQHHGQDSNFTATITALAQLLF